MKIFNEEKGVKKVYVQNGDLACVLHYEDVVPACLMLEILDQAFVVTDENRFEFREFTDPKVIEFMEKADWIPDYKECIKLTEEGLKELGQTAIDEMNQVAVTYNDLVDKDTDEAEHLISRHELLDYKVKSLASLLWLKQGHIKMPVPIVPDSNGFHIENDGDFYAIRQGVNPLQHLLYRTDGKPFDKGVDNNIPAGLINSGDSLCLLENNDESYGNLTVSRELSLDKMYLVSTFTIEQVKKESIGLGKSLKKTIQRIRKHFKSN